MEEKLDSQNSINNSERKLKSTFASFLKNLKKFLIERLSIREGTDAKGTIEEVQKNISFKGPNVWILVCSIFIASIGLNVNSTAVIIGAMLISPLMGPIIGIGLSAGTNDLKLLKRSFKNFGIMVIISLTTSFIYFYLTPLSEAQSELFARINPTLLDVWVAIFGGIAGIVAGSRDEKTNVIPGVAIATALMPPLCTAGYGLAKFNMEFFLGAFYLFLLNSVFICLSTLLVVRYLRFPLASFLNKERENRVKRWIAIVTILITLPSGWIFWNIIQESIFKGKTEAFITQHMDFEHTKVISKKIIYTDTLSIVEVFLIGEVISRNQIDELNIQLQKFGLKNAKLKINQGKEDSDLIAGKLTQQVKSGIIEDLYKKNQEFMEEKDKKIKLLEDQLYSYKTNETSYKDLNNELQAVYENMEQFSYGKMFSRKFQSNPDTTFTFLVKWDSQVSIEKKKELNKKLAVHLMARMKLKDVKIANFAD